MLEGSNRWNPDRIRTLGQCVTSVQWDTEGGVDSRVEGALGVVDGLRDEV